jgi:hypothetical protein
LEAEPSKFAADMSFSTGVSCSRVSPNSKHFKSHERSVVHGGAGSEISTTLELTNRAKIDKFKHKRGKTMGDARKRATFPVSKTTIDDIIFPVKTKRGIKYERKQRNPK